MGLAQQTAIRARFRSCCLLARLGDIPHAPLGGLQKELPTSPKHHLDCFDEFTIRFIRSKVRQLIGRAGLTEADRDDLLQEFALDLIQRRQQFDPRFGTWEAFVVVVCENRLATIL